jgi:hypothetical protein
MEIYHQPETRHNNVSNRQFPTSFSLLMYTAHFNIFQHIYLKKRHTTENEQNDNKSNDFLRNLGWLLFAYIMLRIIIHPHMNFHSFISYFKIKYLDTFSHVKENFCNIIKNSSITKTKIFSRNFHKISQKKEDEKEEVINSTSENWWNFFGWEGS